MRIPYKAIQLICGKFLKGPVYMMVSSISTVFIFFVLTSKDHSYLKLQLNESDILENIIV